MVVGVGFRNKTPDVTHIQKLHLYESQWETISKAGFKSSVASGFQAVRTPCTHEGCLSHGA